MRALPPQARKEAGLAGTVAFWATLVVTVFVVRAFLFQPFNIPSGSMKGTLLVGDHLFVSKFSYGFSRYSMPFAPIPFSGRIFASPPHRGDIIVFRLNVDGEANDLIKRLIGLPGDRIQVIGGHLIINGQPVQRERVEDFVGEDACSAELTTKVTKVRQWRETLPEGVTYNTLDCADGVESLDDTPVFTVPPGHYFMMGDNRDNSTDSRIPAEDGGVGFVPFENMLGRAQIVFFSIHEAQPVWAVWRWPSTVRWHRFFTILR